MHRNQNSCTHLFRSTFQNECAIVIVLEIPLHRRTVQILRVENVRFTLIELLNANGKGHKTLQLTIGRFVSSLRIFPKPRSFRSHAFLQRAARRSTDIGSITSTNSISTSPIWFALGATLC